jgi:hypothetical protein
LPEFLDAEAQRSAGEFLAVRVQQLIVAIQERVGRAGSVQIRRS